MRRLALIIALAVLAIVGALPTALRALTPGQQVVLFSGCGVPSWLCQVKSIVGVAPSNYADYTTTGTSNHFYVNGQTQATPEAWWAARAALPGGSGGVFSRASTAWGAPSSQLLKSYGSGIARDSVVSTFGMTPDGKALGRRYEGAATDLALWNRDLTNAAWSATSATVAKNQTGIDGVANAASSITATANNATVLQAITSASAQRASAAYVKRLVGTGTISMTVDGGTTWTDVTASVNSSGYTRVPTGAGLVQAAVTNPIVGFKLGTSGDEIAVDFVTIENAAFVSSPEQTTSSSASRAADSQTLTRAAPTAITKVIAGRTPPAVNPSLSNVYWVVDNNDNDQNFIRLYTGNGGNLILLNRVSNSTNASINLGSLPANTDFVIALRVSTNGSLAASINGGTVQTAAGTLYPSIIREREGTDQLSGSELYSTIARTAEWTNYAVSNSALQALSLRMANP